MFCFCAFVQLGSGLKLTVFRSESTGAAVKGWARAARKKHKSPDHVHEPLSPHERVHGISPHERVHGIGILGLNKAIDEHGHPVDIPLGTKIHNGHVETHRHKNGHSHDQHPQGQHPDSHLRTEGAQSMLFIFPLMQWSLHITFLSQQWLGASMKIIMFISTKYVTHPIH